MARTFIWGDDDWYRTTSFIFAGNDDCSLSKERIVEIFKYYYNKFYTKFDSINVTGYLRSVQNMMYPPSLAKLMFSNKEGFRINYEGSMQKQELFEKLLKSFDQVQQFEILQRFFDEEIFNDDGYDSEYLRRFINASDDLPGLIKKNEALFSDRRYRIDEKRDVLNNLLRKLEPLREEIKELGAKYDDIFAIGNNLNIRHNNLEGKERKEVVVNMPNKELVTWYNDLFCLIKIVINLLHDKNFYKHYEKQDEIFTKIKALKKQLK